MNASNRWGKEFISALNCVRCKTKDNLALYWFDGTPVDVESTPIEKLLWSIDRMDAWCSSCPAKVNSRVAGAGRRVIKEEANILANARIAGSYSARFDSYNSGGLTITKQDLIAKVKNYFPCQHDQQYYPEPVLGFYDIGSHKVVNISAKAKKSYTLSAIVEMIEECAILCANCQKCVLAGIQYPPTKKVVLDENFWSSTF